MMERMAAGLKERKEIFSLGETFLEVQGIRTRYLDQGVGEPTVLLVHGGSCDCATLSWRPVIPLLSRSYRVVALDLPGFGKSGMPRGECSAEFLIQFLLAFIRKLNLGPVALTGLSMGGLVSIGLVLEAPSATRCLALVGSAGLRERLRWGPAAYLIGKMPFLHSSIARFVASSPACSRLALRLFLSSGKRVPQDLLEEVRDVLATSNAGRGWRSFLSCEAGWSGFLTNYASSLSRIGIPVLLVHGKQDRLVPYGDSLIASRVIPGAELELFDNCGHWVPRERPEDFCRVMRRFMERRLGESGCPRS